MLARSMIRILAPQDPDYSTRLRSLTDRSAETPPAIEAAARDVIHQVRRRGDAAVRELTAKFEKRDVDKFELPRSEWGAIAAKVEPGVRLAIERAAARVRKFHEREKYASFEIAEGGVRVGQRVAPLARVGLYVPGGTARYPSTVIMTAVPAKVAGVKEVVMTTPGPSPETIAAALESHVDRIFVVGGAQAVAALAYGTETIPRVDKIVGPGNAYVAAAKRLVFGDVGIDSIAGPTELVVAADDSVDPSWVAADLLAQAEHDVLAVPILIAVGADVAKRVAAEVERQVKLLPRREIAEKALRDQGAIFVVEGAKAHTDAEVVRIMNLLAPEHAELAMRDARALGEGITTAGALFLGSHTPESVGDYIAGPSHVLPTGGSARFFSPLSVADFVKRTSIIEYDAAALQADGAAIEALAEVEGLHAHGRAVSIRTRG
jgi:histidinol dehydrogenase